MSAHFRLGSVGYGRSLYTHPKVERVVERAHDLLRSTRGDLTIRENTSDWDGMLVLRRPDSTPDVLATWQFNVNRAPTSVVPEWVGDAVAALERLRTVTTVGMSGGGR